MTALTALPHMTGQVACLMLRRPEAVHNDIQSGWDAPSLQAPH
jgi:hypothetical protein